MIRWLRGLWAFYLEYTHTGVHTAAAAALAIFGLLVVVDPLFAVLAVGSYVVPPVLLYAFEAQEETGETRLAEGVTTEAAPGDRPPRSRSVGNTDSDGIGDTDSNSSNGDTDSDSDDGDTDTDSDRDDGDTDTDNRPNEF